MKMLTLSVLLLATAWPAGAQNRPQRPNAPPRDNRAAEPAPTGTARLVGRVVAADSGKPLRMAQVRLSSPELRLTRVGTTSPDGRYEFTQLPAGRYSVAVSKTGYVMLQFGQQASFDPGKPIELREGQALDGIDFSLPRGSVITGRVSDEYGEPIAQAQVIAQRYQYDQNGQRRLSNVMSMGSDDLGQFRIYGLPPGDYIVSATMRGPMVMPGTDSSPADPPTEGYAPTYYPGVADASEAQAVTVGVGQEAGAFFSLLPARMARISGFVTDSQGKPFAGGTVMLTTPSGMGFVGNNMGAIRGDGSFAIANVSPGDHVLTVRSQGRPGDGEFASVPITVAGANITGLQIVTGRGATISGRVTFDGATTRPSAVMIFPTPLDRQAMGMPFGGPQANGRVDADGKFEMRGLFGKTLFRTNVPAGWALKSVSLEGNDITDVPLDLRGSEAITSLEVVLTDKVTEVSGGIKDSQGQALKSYVVVLVPSSVKDGTVATRFIRSARPDQEGRFLVRGLPPGDYAALAVPSLEQGREWDPELQERARTTGKGFTLKDGDPVTLDLALAP